jgi:hypothetical protein
MIRECSFFIGKKDYDLLFRIDYNIVSQQYQRIFRILFCSVDGTVWAPNSNDAPNNMAKSDIASDDDKWIRFEVTNLCLEHYMRCPFPSFSVRLVQRNGAPIVRTRDEAGREQPICDIRVRVTLHNKWADVTNELLAPGSAGHLTMIDGQLVVPNWVFHDISHKHGGFFRVHIEAVDEVDEVVPWVSDRIIIHSDKVLAKKLRTGQNPLPKTASSRSSSRASSRSTFADYN